MNVEHAALSPVLVVDTESNGKDLRHDADALIQGVAVAYKYAGTIYSDYWATDEITPEWRELIANHSRLVMHNAKYDLIALELIGIPVMQRPFYDTMLMGHWINENMLSKSLDFMSRRYGGKPKNKSKEMKRLIKTYGWDAVPFDMMREYSANDAEITYELFEKLYPVFQEEGYDTDLWDIEQAFVRLIIRMESYGVAIDAELCARECEFGLKRLEEINRELKINVGSREHLEVLLIDVFKLKPFKVSAKTNKPSFDKESMEHYESELELRDDNTARLVLEYRGWQKAVSSYYKSYLSLQSANGNVHPSFKLHGTRTGRLSCEKPNFQQIPRRSNKRWNGNAKRAIVPRDGFRLWEADYANLEFRLGAIYSKEPNMVGPLQKGFKPFDAMAELLHGPDWTQDQRQACKTETYMTSYGAGVAKIASTLRITLTAAQQRRSRFWQAYPGLQSVTKRASRNALRRGYAPLWTGRRRHLSFASEAHKALNSIIQGGAAELVKRVMLTLAEYLDWSECRMLLQVHDSVVFEIKIGTEDRWLPIIRAVMQSVSVYHPSFNLVPFPVDIKQWGS